jgi:alkylation response protein AidB-like acyl-CoA dehydrogenase
MTQTDALWGQGPGPDYDALASRFRPAFAAITDTNGRREREHALPLAEIDLLRESGLTRVRLAAQDGGQSATLPQLFNLIIELAEADSSIAQALRVHFGVLDDVLNLHDHEKRALWTSRIAAGELIAVGFTEPGEARAEEFSTRLSDTPAGLRLNGEKFYTTGSLYADWIDVAATDAEGKTIFALVRRDAAGVTVLDDWDGFGQKLSASGTARFNDVEVAAENLLLWDERFRYAPGFYQVYHLATLVGIGRAVVRDTVAELSKRRRGFSHALTPLPRHDGQVLQVVGKVRAQVYASQAIVLKAAEALERAYAARFAGDDEAETRANDTAEIETAQAQSVVIDLILAASASLFDALSASATRSGLGLDRHWRNARTLASHNPRIYKDRIVGDYVVNNTPPPYQWLPGIQKGAAE